MARDLPDLDLPPHYDAELERSGQAPSSGLRKGVELEDDGGSLPPLALESRPPPPRPPQGIPGRGSIDLDDDDPLDGGAAPLRLQSETSHPPPAPTRTDAARAGTPAMLRGLEAAPPSARGKPAPLPGLPPTEAELDAERRHMAAVDAQVRAIARIGPAPQAIWEAPLYAIRVYQRRRELAAELPQVRDRVEEAEAVRGDLFIRVVDTARRGVGPEHAIAAMVAPLARFDEMSAASGEALQAANQSLHEQIQAIDKELSRLEDEVKRLDRDIEAADRELQKHNEQRARSEAKVKRAEIELRAANDAARAAAGPDAKFAPPEHARRITDLTADKQARDAEHAPIQAAFAAAEGALRQLTDTQRSLRKQMTPLVDRRRSAQRSGAAQVAAKVAGSEAIERERRAAYAEVGVLILEGRPQELSDDDRASIRRADEALAARRHDLVVHERAMVEADPAALRRGQTILVVAGLLVILLVVLPLVL